MISTRHVLTWNFRQAFGNLKVQYLPNIMLGLFGE